MAEKILIADDDKDARFLWKVVAREQGLEVIEVGNGRDAVDTIESDAEISLVILDVMMPLMNGYKVLQQIRAAERTKTLPVIISTANRTTQSLGEVTVDEFTIFVNKASGIDNMRRGIVRALGRGE
ncbi:MAG: response regulator [Acidobacteria bacterium]|nr:response regulator [Acidobacteriota bacterium]MCW5967234.1 response regulator [Blastocatellales bacterium]